MRQAEEGVEALQKMVDTLIIIPNQNLFRLANEKTTFTDAFSMADDGLYQGVKGVTDLMVRPGLINLDFADVRAVMDEMGKAMMGTGEADGEDRAIQAAEKAIANPLLDEMSLAGAKGVLINITGGDDLTLFELDEAANRIREEVDPEANIIVGSTMDPSLGGKMRVSVVATGIDAVDVSAEMPVPRRRLAEPLAAPVAETPAPDAAPVAQTAPVQEQMHAFEEPVAEAPAQPTLDVFDAHAASESHEESFAATDDLPPPAYQPRQEPVYHQSMHEPEADAYVAPRAPSAGTPSPEAVARLQAAVTNRPAAHAAPSAPQGRPFGEAEPAQQKQGRFGINSLIGRMTGGAPEAPEPQARQAAPAPRASAQPQAHQAYEEEQEPSPEQEKIEIPAFLRRQAN
jgi:cell division protein FtsZ